MIPTKPMNNPEQTIFLGGGGSKEQSAALDAAFIEHMRRSARELLRVAYIPVAMQHKQEKFPYGSCLEWFEDIFKDRIDLIEMWTDLSGITTQDLQMKSAVYIGGGDTDVLLQHIRSTGFESQLLRYLQEGGTYYGGSAGAIILGKDIRTADEVRARAQPIVDSFTGLNILHGYSVFPHYNKGQTEFSAETVRRLVTELDTSIVAVPETSGVIVREGQMYIVGTDAVSIFSSARETKLLPNEQAEIDLPRL